MELDFLGAARYANGESAAQTDYIEEVGSDYVAQAHQMHALPRYANCVHGRVASDSTGVRWLQYWFFMYYDNPRSCYSTSPWRRAAATAADLSLTPSRP
jgi:hypothetical protein